MRKELQGAMRQFWFDWVPRHVYRISTDQKFETRITELNELLVRNPKMSVALYFNHISYADAIHAFFVAQKINQEQAREMMVFASYSHTVDPEHRNLAMVSMVELARKFGGVSVDPVIQTYQLKEDSGFHYPPKLVREVSHQVSLNLKRRRLESIPTICVISPEGHRSEKNVLWDKEHVEKGVLHIGRELAPVVYVPLGIWYQGEYNRSGINLGRRVNLSIGETVTQETRSDGPTLETLMYSLALAIPPKMRGEWGG